MLETQLVFAPCGRGPVWAVPRGARMGPVALGAPEQRRRLGGQPPRSPVCRGCRRRGSRAHSPEDHVACEAVPGRPPGLVWALPEARGQGGSTRGS